MMASLTALVIANKSDPFFFWSNESDFDRSRDSKSNK